jgi:hypothetical protein
MIPTPEQLDKISSNENIFSIEVLNNGSEVNIIFKDIKNASEAVKTALDTMVILPFCTALEYDEKSQKLFMLWY